jgi:hypothetical protein
VKHKFAWRLQWRLAGNWLGVFMHKIWNRCRAHFVGYGGLLVALFPLHTFAYQSPNHDLKWFPSGVYISDAYPCGLHLSPAKSTNPKHLALRVSDTTPGEAIILEIKGRNREPFPVAGNHNCESITATLVFDGYYFVNAKGTQKLALERDRSNRRDPDIIRVASLLEDFNVNPFSYVWFEALRKKKAWSSFVRQDFLLDKKSNCANDWPVNGVYTHKTKRVDREFTVHSHCNANDELRLSYLAVVRNPPPKQFDLGDNEVPEVGAQKLIDHNMRAGFASDGWLNFIDTHVIGFRNGKKVPTKKKLNLESDRPSDLFEIGELLPKTPGFILLVCKPYYQETGWYCPSPNRLVINAMYGKYVEKFAMQHMKGAEFEWDEAYDMNSTDVRWSENFRNNFDETKQTFKFERDFQ